MKQQEPQKINKRSVGKRSRQRLELTTSSLSGTSVFFTLLLFQLELINGQRESLFFKCSCNPLYQISGQQVHEKRKLAQNFNQNFDNVRIE